MSPGPFPVEIPLSNVPESSGLWERITTWASEHKGTVYAIAGVTLVVTAAGTMYYLNSDDTTGGSAPSNLSANKRKTKRDRKKAKERAEKEAAEKKVEEKAGTRISTHGEEAIG
jgi:import receptor subunit TOM70